MQTTSNSELSTKVTQQENSNTQISRTPPSNAPAASPPNPPSTASPPLDMATSPPQSPPNAVAAQQPPSTASPPPSMTAQQLPNSMSSPPNTMTSAQQSPAKTDDEVVQSILASREGTLFDSVMNGISTIYQDVKMTIMALLCIIAGFTQDPIQINRIFRRSPLVPSWWDETLTINGVKGIVSNAVYFCSKAVETYRITIPTVFGPRRLADLNPDENPRYTTDDLGNANLFCDIYQHILKYVIEKKSWYYFDGRIWAKSDGAAMEYCKLLASKMEEYASKIEAVNMIAFDMDELTKKQQVAIINQYRRFSKHTKSRRARETILKDAQSVYGIVASAKDFDTDPYLLCCENGTLNLRDFSFHAHSPRDMITKMVNAVYDPQACSTLWLQHLNTVMDGDQERALFLQKSVGASLIGTNDYCYIVILYGPRTRNGKSVTMDTIKKMMGTYGAVAKPDTFAQDLSAKGSAHNDDVAHLVGIRFVSVPEVEKKMTLSSSLIKRLTGEHEVAVRAIFESQTVFSPQFTLFFHTNFLPRLDDTTPFDSGRIKVIPFTHFFEEHARNPHMVDELTTPQNLSAILNWALEGLWRLKNEGFDAPQSVLEATGQYHKDSDSVGNFITENMQQDGGYAPTRETFLMYRAWCDGAGLPSGREQDFKTEMEKKGIAVARRRIDGKQVTAYLGWSLAK